MFTKIGSFLGTVAFLVIGAIGMHQKIEIDAMNAHRPPTVAQLQGSVVRVLSEGALCSGWILKGSNKVITAAHCFNESETNGPVNAEITFNNGSKLMYQVTKVGDGSSYGGDFAVLEPVVVPVTVTIPQGLPVCSTKPYIGEEVVMMGNPLDADKMISWGHVSNPMIKVPEDDMIHDLNGGMFVDIQMYEGNSGGPVIDTDQGCVIGSAELLIPVQVEGIPIGVGVGFANPIPKDI